MARILKLTICTLHSSPSPYLNSFAFQESLSRYLRILFQLSLHVTDESLAESVLDQALDIARDSHKTPSSYPNEEIQWLATVAFNQAVEFYRLCKDDDFKRWAGKAIALADLMEIRPGELGRLLRRNFAKLLG
ncbi:hypothetical protein EYZ11_011074 [Aspergillus tanneri]|nr:hypothetical protein EYZ11_011074 [Aspergillus tanneri]